MKYEYEYDINRIGKYDDRFLLLLYFCLHNVYIFYDVFTEIRLYI